ncbi:complex I subunit 1 family protein [Segeticoccus rhizosphaerae]|uniref:complex I subunit 1 family protein n=1 Tax=Segeticoccus rhizosphaerae TaxID=1104777 RepID=UPI0010C127D3|nr:complex I subunit 1 family protein [Ornithinicoccus soli]
MSAVHTAPGWSVVVAAGLVLVAAAATAAVDAAVDPASRSVPLWARLGRPVWETARALLAQPRRTLAPDRLLWSVGVVLPLLVALSMATVVPLGGQVVTDLGVGVVWFNAMDVVLWAAWWLVGWAPNSVHSLVGGYRFLAQALAYELPLMFALTAPAVAAGSLSVTDIVTAQQAQLWFVVQMPVAAVVFTGAVAAFSVWGPFAHPAGLDASGGLLVEASGPARLLLRLGQYALLVVGAAMAVALFLGGGAGPVLPAWAWTVLKTAAILVLLVWVRHRVPVWRADRSMRVAWLAVLPATLAQLLVVSILAVSGAQP